MLCHVHTSGNRDRNINFDTNEMNKKRICPDCEGNGGWQYETVNGIDSERCDTCEGTGSCPHEDGLREINLNGHDVMVDCGCEETKN